MKNKERRPLLFPPRSQAFFHRIPPAQGRPLTGKRLTKAILLSLAVYDGLSCMGADTAYAADTCTISHDETAKETTVKEGSTDNSNKDVYGNSDDVIVIRLS